jgi:GTP-binding protein
MTKLPQVVLIGRTNVGKSTLFNRLSETVKSITLDRIGVTRDFLQDTVCWNNASFNFVDTGGVQIKKTHDEIYKRVSEGVFSLLEKADLILFMVDGTTGVVPEEFELTKLLHKLGKPVILVINKGDVKDVEENTYMFDRLGFNKSMVVSAQHGTGVGDLLDLVVENLPYKAAPVQVEKPLKVVIIGKPNAGKSSLLNALLEEERAIVSDVAGTTREPITEKVTFYKEEMAITDTPGLRRKRGIDDLLEQLMVKKAFNELKDADIVLLVIDASAGKLSDQELKLAFYSFERYKALIILFNKYDLVTPEIQAELDFNLAPYDYLINKIKTIKISCKSGRNIGKVLSLIKGVADRYRQQFEPEDLSAIFREALSRRQLYYQGNKLVVYKAKQVKTAPITIVLFVNDTLFFGKSQLAYLDSALRKAHNLEGVPVRFLVRQNSKRIKKAAGKLLIG